MKTLSNSRLTIQVSPHGAELCSIVSGGKEYLWQADPAFWKRHSPVLFPIVGSVWENACFINGKTFRMSQHGFARDMDFEPVFESADEVRFRLSDNEDTREKYPYAFVLEIVHKRDFYAKVLFFIGKRCRLQKTCLNLHDKSDRI